jgi:hypothetical protein
MSGARAQLREEHREEIALPMHLAKTCQEGAAVYFQRRDYRVIRYCSGTLSRGLADLFFSLDHGGDRTALCCIFL